ncbi:MAG: nitrous oxide-stimulated promoter family protein [Anaerolineae bacterium]|jgi:hypothetical protein
MAREQKTVEAMIGLYCQAKHAKHAARQGSNGRLCAECEALQDYARQRLQKCPFQAGKTTCAKCPIHCYKADRREQIRTVMRYAGPRMLLRHPILALLHLADGRREEAVRPQKAKAGRAGTESLEKT